MEWQELASVQKVGETKSAMGLLANWMESSYQLPLLENPDEFLYEKERIASLLVDNHLGKLARKVRLLGESQGLDSDDFLDNWTELSLFVSLWEGFNRLPDGQKLNLIYQSGPNITKRHLKNISSFTDQFIVVGKKFTKEEGLLQRTVYLYGREKGICFIIVDYSFNRKPFNRHYEVGLEYRGGAVRYPFPGSQRISPGGWKKVKSTNTSYDGLMSQSVHDAVKSFSAALSVNPFLKSWPVMIEVLSTGKNGHWQVKDMDGNLISMVERDIEISAPFYAVTYRSPVKVVVLLSKQGIYPLSYFNGEFLIPLENQSDG